MAARVMSMRFNRLLSSFEARGGLCEPYASVKGDQAIRGLRTSSVAPPRKKKSLQRGHVNWALLEQGVTKYFCNRNPRNPELLGIAEKPKGFETTNKRVDYYHRSAS